MDEYINKLIEVINEALKYNHFVRDKTLQEKKFKNQNLISQQYIKINLKQNRKAHQNFFLIDFSIFNVL